MSRTQGRFDQDTANADGHIFLPALSSNVTSGTATFTRSGLGLSGLAVGNSQTLVMEFPLGDVLVRYGQNDFLQEQFGSQVATGAQGNPVGGYTTVSTSSASAGTNVSVAVLNSTGFVAGRAVTAGTQKTFIVSIPDSTHL